MKGGPIKSIAVLCIFCSMAVVANGQTIIQVQNASFEDYPRAGTWGIEQIIEDWIDVGSVLFPDQSPPDIHPHPEAWQVKVEPYDGETFLGMVWRADDSFEAIGQTLQSELLEGTCYEIIIALAQSETYFGIRSYTGSTVNDHTYSSPFKQPLKLQLFGSASTFNTLDEFELIAETGYVDHSDWREYVLRFEPKSNYRNIALRVFYDGEDDICSGCGGGHLLIDGMSDIREVPCHD